MNTEPRPKFNGSYKKSVSNLLFDIIDKGLSRNRRNTGVATNKDTDQEFEFACGGSGM